MTIEQAKTVRSKNIYWEEIARRESDTREIVAHELHGVLRDLGHFEILRIIAKEAEEVLKSETQD